MKTFLTRFAENTALFITGSIILIAFLMIVAGIGLRLFLAGAILVALISLFTSK